MGSLLSKGFVFLGVLSTSMWLLINHSEFYYENIHSAMMMYIISVLGCSFIIYNWFLKLYKEYQAQ